MNLEPRRRSPAFLVHLYRSIPTTTAMPKLSRRRFPLLLAIGSTGLLLPSTLRGAPAPEYMTPTPWPVERMVANLQRWVTENPGDSQGHFVLGRVHALAFTLEAKQLGCWFELEEGAEELLAVPEDPIQRAFYGRDKPDRDGPGPDEMLSHLREGIRHLQRALDLAPQSAAAHLSLGYLIERGAHLAPRLETFSIFRLPQIRIRQDTDEGILQRLQALGSSDTPERDRALSELQERRFFLASLRYLESECLSSNRRRSDGARELLERFWKEQAIEHDRLAFEMALPREIELDTKPLAMLGDGLDTLVSYEAGRAWLRLVEERGPVNETEREGLMEVRDALKRFETLPPTNAITPLILSLEEGARLEDLLLPDSAVLFDLDGDGTDEAWPWLRPGAGFLVWDPQESGRVSSGRQMFGTVSAQLYFDDGYRALSALDDDGDERLSNEELRGVALWFDDDCDGLAEAGEVRPVREHGITALATRATVRIGRSLGNPCGVETADGRFLASYDWVTESL